MNTRSLALQSKIKNQQLLLLLAQVSSGQPHKNILQAGLPSGQML
jgi:hypothetical protein